ncbi:Ig-like domain-containing protein [Singulisphaera sp. PoT]|uniref:Ig-like domain-containing protein n=1 Tax=Singulisphaera sp. PoT TaxID=3411797 RepID=UPI003BF48002
MRSDASEVESKGSRARTRSGLRGVAARNAKLRRMALESLETRTLLSTTTTSTLPSPSVTLNSQINLSGSEGSESTPSIAIDKNNPNKMAAVWVRNDPLLAPGTTVFVEFSFSNDGGNTWASPRQLGNVADPTTSNPIKPYSLATDPSIAFDRDDNFYIVDVNHNSLTSGVSAIVLNRFDFSGSTPVRDLADQIVYQSQQDSALTPILAVDDNLKSFTDTDANGNPYVQSDPTAGSIYIAWQTVNTAPQNATNWNPNEIQLIASSNQGANFSGPITVDTGGSFGSQRYGAPRLAISQGRPANGNEPAVKGGQVTVVYDDFGSGVQNTPVPQDFIWSTVVSGASSQVFTGPGGSIIDATSATPSVVTPTNFTVPVSITDAGFTSLSHLSVTLNITHPSLADLSLVLIPPTGSGLPSVTLIAAGTITGANMGVSTSGLVSGTTLTDFAARGINNQASTAPFLGTYRPELNLDAAYAGATKAQLNGTWTLQITDTKNGSAGSLGGWSLNLVSGMQRGAQTFVTSTDVRGAVGNAYPVKTPDSPLGVAPNATIASDNTLGAYSQFQGRLYLTYVNHIYNAGLNQAANTDIFMRTSDDGGITWSLPQLINDDQAVNDGFSESNSGFYPATGAVTTGRTQFEPEIQVDAATGTVFLSWLDSRNDAANSRVVTYLAASSDGGNSFAPQVFANTAQTAHDAITDNPNVVLGPIPDSQLVGTDTTYGFGTRQGLAVYDGKAFPAWSSNLNGGGDGKQLLDIRTVKATYVAGPRIIASTQGAVQQTTYVSTSNTSVTINAPDSTGTPTVSGFTVTFDRPVDPSTFTAADVAVFYRDTTVANSSGAAIPVTSVVPLKAGSSAFGVTQFLIRFAPRTAVGTYSYEVGPNIRDRIRTVSSTGTSQGNLMDQNGNGVTGEAAATGSGLGDVYAAPYSTATAGFILPPSGQFFPAPYDSNTLPLVLGGPKVVSSSIPNATPSSDNLVTNGSVSSIDITFDRPMDPTSFTAADVLRIMGPSGAIPLTSNGVSTITITPNPLGNDSDPAHPKTFRITFPTQYLSGTYTVQLDSSIKSAAGDAMDANQNAGVDLLKQTPSGTSVAVTYNSTNVPAAISSGTTTTSILNVPAGFLAQDLTLTLNIAYPNDPDLEATLIGPDGTQVQLFTNVGSTSGNPGFSNTIFDDKATTPIQNGGPPFVGRFLPQQPLSAFNGKAAGGQWKLVIKNDAATSTGRIGSLTSWSLTFQKAVPISGLGEPVADQSTVGFRIFADNATNPLTNDTWTSVGPATITNNAPGNGYSGSVTAIAVDPSDPSGNTVYVGGASGGVWKTTNFLTTNPAGPTYIPLTDFGPTFGLNIGSIAVFARNNDPTQSIIIAGTGNANAIAGNGGLGGNTSQGVGFLLSTDGGATWTLLDSTDNSLAFASRDHLFAANGGTSTYKVIVDPRPTPTGQVIMYAAMGGTNGGLWRSIDTGQHWTLMKSGQATDVTFDLNSATVDVNSNPTGNVNVLYAAFAGDGVYISPNRGQSFDRMNGGNVDPLIRDPDTTGGGQPQAITVNNGTFPTSGIGRITLAKPALIASNVARADVQNLLYEGWIYAAVANTNGKSLGLYLTKDNGTTWTRIYTGTVPSPGTVVAQPSNNPSQSYYDTLGSNTAPNANYNISVTVDPNNPNIVYLGGTNIGQTSGLIRIDATTLYDSHAAVAYDNSRPAGGTEFSSNGRVVLKDVNRGTPTITVFRGNRLTTFSSDQYLNLLQDPTQPYLANSTIYLSNVASFTNDGSGVTWIPFDEMIKSSSNDLESSTGVHQMISIVDPLTGNARLIVADDQGVFTGVDLGNGNLSPGIGNQASPTYSRNGNLQIAQFYYGAAQPSNVAAQAAQALIYGNGLHTGIGQSDPNVVNNGSTTDGNTNWTAPTQGTLGSPNSLNGELDGVGVQVSQQGGMADPNNPGQKLDSVTYQYVMPGLGGLFSDFFQVSVNGNAFVGRTTGLVQVANDPQWPLASASYTNGVVQGNFAVNPLDGNQVIISSNAGRIFSTTNQGRSWLVIGDPNALDGTYAPALTYGAPDPNAPAGVGNLNNFLYAGTVGGHIFVSQTGGGTPGVGNAWTDISTGLDGSPVMKIVADPTRGSHAAYAVTQAGVYWTANSLSGASTVWTNITGNLFNLTTSAFGNSDLTSARIAYLTSMVADWRYVIPNTSGGGSHPVLYVSAEPGVYRSLDNGTTWQIFPDNSTTNGTTPLPTNGAVAPVGGNLPNVHITDLSLALGNIDPTTGRPIATAGDPNNLVASTLGRGTFTIRLAPIVFPNTASSPNNIHLDTTSPPPAGSQAGTASDGTPLVTVARPVIDGFSQQTAFGNKARITFYDLTNPSSPRIIGGYDPSNSSTDVAANWTTSSGSFSIQVNAGAFTFNGKKTIGIQATDASGTKGNMATFVFTLNANLPLPNPPATPTLALSPADDSSGGQKITNVTEPTLLGATDPSTSVKIYKSVNGSPTGPALISGTTDSSGNFILKFASPLADGVYTVQAVATNVFGSSNSQPLTFTIDTHGPTTAPTLLLSPTYDTGIKGDNITSARTPFFIGVTEPNAIVDLYDASTFNPSNPGGNKVLATTTADASGNYKFQLPFNLTNGAISLIAQARDVAGNVGPDSSTLTIQVVTVATDYNNDGKSDLALFERTNPLATWSIQGVTPTGGTLYGSGTKSIPVEGDFIGNGKDQLAYYNPGTATWFIDGLYPNGIQFGMALVDIPVPGDYFGTHVDTIATWRPTTGEWFIGGSPNAPIKLGSQGDIPVPGDYDNIGRTEPAVYNPTTGTFSIYNPLTGTTRSIQVGSPGQIPVPGQYDNTVSSHRTEPAVYNPTTGLMTILGPNNVTRTVQFTQGSIPAPGDYDGDGIDQPAAFLPATGTWTIYNPAGTSSTTTKYGDPGDIPVAGPFNYRKLPVQGDYVGNGFAQFTIFRRTSPTGTWYIGGVSGPNGTKFGPANSIPLQGDFDGNGLTDLATFNSSTATWYVQGLYPNGVQYGAANLDIAVPADYNGVGTTTIAVWRPTTGQWFVAGHGDPLATFGAGANNTPVPGNYDGTGKAEFAVFMPATSSHPTQWQIMGPNGLYTVAYGGANDIPVPGDFDGVGKTQLAVYRPSTQQWFIAGHAQAIQFGGPGDIPVPGDYDGVGHLQIAVYRPSTNQLFIAGHATPIQFGGPGDVPVEAPYAYRVPGNTIVAASVQTANADAVVPPAPTTNSIVASSVTVSAATTTSPASTTPPAPLGRGLRPNQVRLQTRANALASLLSNAEQKHSAPNAGLTSLRRRFGRFFG